MYPVASRAAMRSWIGLLMVTAALAGCSEDGTEPAGDDPQDLGDLELEATDETGVIRGVVIDQAIVPIGGATVQLLEPARTTETNEKGAFGFDGLDPGTYFLEVDKPGYTEVQQSVAVEAGVDRPEVVKVLLERDPSKTPFVTPFQWDGFIECGLSVIALCGVAGDALGDDFVTEHELDTPGVQYLQSEMVWDTTQAVSPNMWLWQEASGEGGCSFDNPQGPSPIVINTTYGDWGRYGDRECFETLGNTTDIQLRVFSGSIDGTRPPINDGCYPLVITELCSGIGATIEQEFSVFTHAFYRFEPPEGWQFSVDGPPEVPG